MPRCNTSNFRRLTATQLESADVQIFFLFFLFVKSADNIINKILLYQTVLDTKNIFIGYGWLYLKKKQIKL